MADKKPASANEVLASVNDDHDWRHAPEDLHSTGGIQRSCQRNADAIQALADFIDGKSTRAMPGYEAPDTKPAGVQAGIGGQRSAEQGRIDQQSREAKAEYAAGTPPGPNGPDDFGRPGVERQTPANVGQRPA